MMNHYDDGNGELKESHEMSLYIYKKQPNKQKTFSTGPTKDLVLFTLHSNLSKVQE